MSSPTTYAFFKNPDAGLQLCISRVFMHTRTMKTITLTEAAYERLKAWKAGKDSFSQVVLRVVPKRGTFGDLDEAFKALPTLSGERSRVMLETIVSRGEPQG
jgi:predicted CopG family antitoxin